MSGLALQRWGAWGEAMDEAGTTSPCPRRLSMANDEGSADQEVQGREQGGHDMTQRAGLVPIAAGINDL
jgi:hypothetical protein